MRCHLLQLHCKNSIRSRSDEDECEEGRTKDSGFSSPGDAEGWVREGGIAKTVITLRQGISGKQRRARHTNGRAIDKKGKNNIQN